MKAKKAEVSFVAYGANEDEALENLRFDIFDAMKDGGENVAKVTDVDTKEEGIDDFEYKYMQLDEVIERNLEVDLETGQVLDEYRNVYLDEEGEVCFISKKELEELIEDSNNIN
jgi:SHS2 domain-containing protein